MMYDDLCKLRKEFIGDKNMHDMVVCTIEEMSEVTKVLTKFLRCSNKFDLDDLTEELAHAMLMLDVTRSIFHIESEEIVLEQIKALKKALPIKDDSDE